MSLQYVIKRCGKHEFWLGKGDRWITDPIYAHAFDYIADADMAGLAPDFPLPVDQWTVVGVEIPEPVEGHPV